MFEETLATYGIGGGEWGARTIQDGGGMYTRFRSFCLTPHLSRTRLLRNWK